MRSTRRPATRGESTTTCCSAVRTVMRSMVEVTGASDAVETTGRFEQATTAPTRKRENERHMVSLEEGDGNGTRPWGRRCRKKKPPRNGAARAGPSGPLERLQERDEIRHFLWAETHLKPQIVERRHLRETRRGAVVEERCPGREPAENRPFDSTHVGAKPRDQCASRIGRVTNRPRQRARSAGHLEDRKVWHTQLPEGGRDLSVGFISRGMTGADVERHGERVVADVRRIVARRASPVDRRH